ncbi:HAD-IC family P-type ATPase [Microcella alkaliphila]|uniref:Cation-transporting ATPase n=1 Tax=Microcella alkaliphila TaxID=279828 RepID=A0A0U5B4X4_9MICO|nr:HAD-IC family P-type ATPase [Microcella alkaliphila]BAU30932.1 cation-transporting ATPase [Microcella alkaliphila]
MTSDNATTPAAGATLSAPADAPTGERGLTEAEARDRFARGLGNAMPSSTGRSFWRIMQANLFTLFNGVVGGCFILLLVLGYWQDALFGVFVIANVLIGVGQEFRAKLTLSRLAVLNAPNATVLRDGVPTSIPLARIVMDDVLVLGAGDQVAADAVVIEAQGLEVDESLLTGEADAINAPIDRELLSGSTIVGGRGLARVVRVGAESYAAKITAEAKQFSLVNSELRQALARVITWISWLLIPVGLIAINGQMQALGGWETAIANGTWREASVGAIAGLIAMIPQGLVFMTSVSLAVGAVKLSQKQVLVQELAAVEGLARVDILCLDKTGTLTEGQLVLDAVEPVGRALAADDPALASSGHDWRAVLAAVGADPQANATAAALREPYPAADAPAPVATIDFSSHRKWSALQLDDPRAAGTWVVGAPDIVLADSVREPLSAETLGRTTALAEAGRRVLVLARTEHPLAPVVDGEQPPLPAGLAPVAIVSFREKVRDDAPETLRFFAEQGVELCVISGDDPRTVAAVAREAGVAFDGEAMDARKLPSDPAALDAIMADTRVFGRVVPEQKKQMVLSLQRLGRTVAMTGDGVNDALALKYADMGIAMGSGAAATRAVARLVLLDGQFSRLPRILAEGRQVIANVERLAKLFLSKTTYAVMFAVVFGVLLWEFPLLPRQFSITDGLTIGLPAIVFALLTNTRVYRPGFLTRAARFCVPKGLTVGVVLISVVAWARFAGDYSLAQIQTAATITLTLTALWVLVTLARPFTWLTSLIIAGSYAGLAVVLFVPWFVEFLQFEMPDARLAAVSIGASLVGNLVIEIFHRRVPS